MNKTGKISSNPLVKKLNLMIAGCKSPSPGHACPTPEIITGGADRLPPAPVFRPDETENVVEEYWLTEPFSSVRISALDDGDIRYLITEPKLTEKELIVLEEVYERLRAVLVYDTPTKRREVSLDAARVKKIIKSFVPEITEERSDVLIYYLGRNFTGYGKLDPLMHDEMIEDITCNGADTLVYVYHRKYANLPTNLRFENQELNKYALKLAQKADKQISLTTPLIDAALPEGSRAQITYSDIVSSKGSSFTIRRFQADPMTPVDLLTYGTYDENLLAYIWLAVENGKSIIVVGGTASGKTSTMNAISFFIPPNAKIVSLEDTREIQIPNQNWLPMKTRESGLNLSKGDVDLFSLLKSSLRQRPEYIIVGEVRGKEAQTLFQAMNTGHTTFSTLHAGGVKEAVNRLTHDPINVPTAMFGALDLMVIQSLQYVEGRGIRRCLSLNEVYVEEGVIGWNPLFVWDPHTDTFQRTDTSSRVLDRIAYSHGWSEEDIQKNLHMRAKTLRNMTQEQIRGVGEVGARIHELRKSLLHGSE
ncbi:type II/IV secretion system ATPase subunit [Methanogenium cariaci]|jgi:archaeal flagellar protein FlaI